MTKLTKLQAGVLRRMAGGVKLYCGVGLAVCSCWFAADRKMVARQTFDVLLERGFIEKCNTDQASHWWRDEYQITEAGRQALPPPELPKRHVLAMGFHLYSEITPARVCQGQTRLFPKGTPVLPIELDKRLKRVLVETEKEPKWYGWVDEYILKAEDGSQD